MKNLWLRKYYGYVTVKIEGKGLERFINKLVKENIRIWNVKRQNQESITFQMFVRDVPHLRSANHYHRVKLRFLKKSGLPFYTKRLKRNTGFIAGAVIALLIITSLSKMIWHDEIHGESPETEYKLSNQLKQLGIRKGGFQFLVDDPETLQRKLSGRNEEITWIGVEVRGTTYRFQVVEKERPEQQKKKGPQHLVAKKEAVIVDYFVEKGQPVISVHEFVKPGQLLVSGLIGKEKEPDFVSAKGKVLGKTWYDTKVEVKLKNKFKVLTGNDVRKKAIKIGSRQIPVWGFENEQYKYKQTEVDEVPLKFLKWTTPVSFIKMTVREVEVKNKTYTEKEAKKLALSLAKKNLMETIPEDADIIDEKVLHEKVENGKLKLLVSYDVIENIAKEVPITVN